MFCRKCGAKLHGHDQFCPDCGTAVVAFSAPVTSAPETSKKNNVISIIILAVSILLAFVIVVCIVTISLSPSSRNEPDTMILEEATEEVIPEETVDSANPIPDANPYRECYTDSEYILPESNTRYYSAAELADLSDQQLEIAHGEISARHGVTASNADLQEYFENLSWYHAGGNAKLNEYETENQFLVDACLRLRNGSLNETTNEYFRFFGDNSSYLLTGSDQRYVSGSELSRMAMSELILAHNEIYARHGFIFTDSKLKEYFCCKSWYQPKAGAPMFNDSMLSSVESDNIALIMVYENLSAASYPSSDNPYMYYYNSYTESIFPNSSSYVLDEWDYKGMSIPELVIARNEIFARNGYCFTDDDLMEYFLQCSWYLPQVPPGRLDLVSLNSVERANVNRLLEYQRFVEANMGGSAWDYNW